MRYKDIVCAVCGAVCDDIEVDLGESGDSGIMVYNACKLGKAKFHELRSDHRIKKPRIRVVKEAALEKKAAGGDNSVEDTNNCHEENDRDCKGNGSKHGGNDNGFKESSWEDALQRSAEILRNAKHPLLFMGAEASTEAIGVGIRLAEYLGGVVDSHPTVCHGPTVMGVQEAGLPSATLGEVKNRADLIMYWGTNPMQSHLRHMSRYSTFPRGYFKESGKKEREVWVIDPRETSTAKIADVHIQIEPNKDYELMSAIRATLKGHKPDKPVGGVEIETICNIAERMNTCKYGVIFLGLGIASSAGKHRNLESALRLVREINKYARFILIPNLGHGNVSGFLQTMTWNSGYPFGVDYSRGYPRYNPGEFTTVDLLRRKEVDALLVVAADLVSHFPRSVVEYMTKIPMISVDISNGPTPLLSDVVLPGVITGMESGGTIYRMDHVPLRLKKFIDPPFDFTKSDEDTLKQLFGYIENIK